MKESPILFSGPMVRALLAGTKTQTRRVVQYRNSTVLGQRSNRLWAELDWTRVRKDHGPHMLHNEASEYLHVGTPDDTQHRVRCTYEIGDRLWVRETHWRYGQWAKNGKTKSGKQAWKFHAMSGEVRFTDQPKMSDRTVCGWYRRPSIFLPKGTARINLEITDIRVEGLKEISEADAKAEGVVPAPGVPVMTNKHSYRLLWDTLNAARGLGWDANPRVWAITFRRVE